MPDPPDPADQNEAPGATRERFDHLVVIGSSAGGVDALINLVGTLPADFPAACVIAQHLYSRRESLLGEILAARCTLPVRTVTAHEKLDPGVVYVIASDLDFEINDHAVSVGTDANPAPKPSVDRLLETA